MLNIENLTDMELTVLFRGVSLLKNCKLSLSEKAASIELHSELSTEINERMIETTTRWK